MMTFAIVGAGGVGGLIGGLLAAAGNDVRFLARGEHGRAIRERGLTLRGPSGDLALHRVRAEEDPHALGVVDVVLVAVKAWQVAEVAPSLSPLLGERTWVVPLQNGVEAAPRLAAVLGEDRVSGGLCHMLSRVEAPGVIHWMGSRPSVTLGERATPQVPRIDSLRATFESAEISVVVSDDIEASLWEKLLFIAPLGSVGASARSPIGVVRSMPETRRLLSEAMAEIEAVARARGVRLAEGAATRALARVDALPPDATASMHRDIVAGRPSELHELTGAAVRFGHEAAVSVTVNELLLAVLAPQEAAARGR